MRIKFIAQGSNTLVGGFSHGDIANVGDALAKHLVEEAKVAEYVKAESVKAKPKPQEQPIKPQEQPRPVSKPKGKA